MKEFWRSKSRIFAWFLICCLSLLNSNFCWSLNDEGVALLKFKEQVVSDPYGSLSNWNDEVGVESPCSWFGVECSNGFVVVLNLRDCCLRGTLAPDLGNLVYVKSIILRNNSFTGVIPEEIANLKELEVLDLGYNNFSGHIPCALGNNFSMAILLLDNNELLYSTNPEIYELQKLSEAQVEEHLLSGPIGKRAFSCNVLVVSRDSFDTSDATTRKLLQNSTHVSNATRRTPAQRYNFPPMQPALFPPHVSPSQSPAPSPSPSSSPSPSPSAAPSPSSPSAVPNNSQPLFPNLVGESNTDHRRTIILSAAIGGPILLILLGIGIFVWKTGKVATVKPWATGLSGQLQRVFVSGVPKLKRSELVAACEDFSNVIGSSSFCTLYKGTLSTGVEIAVASLAVTSPKDWSNRESQFRKKIDTLSKVNHKNFVNLLGYCEEEKPFTRIMVFEYAPNGTLFEHLHIREAEHLDWTTRLRIMMGMAYCLNHMHQLTPPLIHGNLTSSCVYLTEDYAAKISDFVFRDKRAASEAKLSLPSNVYSFGVVLFEMITGKLPYSAGSDSLEDCASDYLRIEQPLRERVDPTLRTYGEEELERIYELIRSCTDPEPRRRPDMKEVCAKLREITGIGPEEATPKVSPLWWAELEIQSSEAP